MHAGLGVQHVQGFVDGHADRHQMYGHAAVEMPHLCGEGLGLDVLDQRLQVPQAILALVGLQLDGARVGGFAGASRGGKKMRRRHHVVVSVSGSRNRETGSRSRQRGAELLSGLRRFRPVR
ncbi:hypothetical protein G6F63_016502 [Rhizopus arrhizus]|nr:hypothetical protein G6F63_016502 [Rhizopus arrhizus]